MATSVKTLKMIYKFLVTNIAIALDYRFIKDDILTLLVVHKFVSRSEYQSTVMVLRMHSIKFLAAILLKKF